MMFFFFFKQKTAYEMRISDWSSDVCSSGLLTGIISGLRPLIGDIRPQPHQRPREAPCRHLAMPVDGQVARHGGTILARFQRADARGQGFGQHRNDAVGEIDAVAARSEEHTSELQSLMRISYAVFCLKKNKK